MDKSLILKRLQDQLGFSTSKEFADFLGISPATLSNWHSRNSFDLDLIVSKCKDININWLLTGDGEILKTNQITSDVLREREMQLEKELAFQKAIIELQQKLIASLEETKKEMESRLRDINEKNKNNSK